MALGGCDTAPDGGGGGGGGPAGAGSTIQWWDQFNPLKTLHEQQFADFAADGGAMVAYTVYNPAEQGQALQLAFSSQQLPDVFTLAGVNVPPAQLLEQGWFSPLDWDDATVGVLTEAQRVEGITMFDGKLYTFPIFSFRQYETLNWFNRTLVEAADLDPDDPPTSWDDYRSALRDVQDANDGVAGVILPLQLTPRMSSIVTELAQTAGHPGSREGNTEGIDLTTGEYAFGSEPFVMALEFLVSLSQDGLMFEASTSLDARAGRARWAAGASGFFLDGPYCPGVIKGDFASFLEQLAVGPIPTPDGDTPVLTRPPQGGTFWVSGQSQNVEAASDLLATFLEAGYQQGLAASMDQPPSDLEAVADSDAHPTYKRCIEFFTEQVFLGPAPVARNPAVSAVAGIMEPVEPDLGQIVQGVFSGDVSDIQAALTDYSDKLTAARDAAIAEVTGQGMQVSVEDWAFADWQKGEDFPPEAYTE